MSQITQLTYKRVILYSLHTRISHVTHLIYTNESYHTNLTWMRHVTSVETHMNASRTYTDESCHTYEWVLSRVWKSHVTCINESCHVTCINESCHTYECDMSYHTTYTYEWVTPHNSHFAQSRAALESFLRSHVTHMTESYRTYHRVVSYTLHLTMSHVTQLTHIAHLTRCTIASSLSRHAPGHSCHTYEWVMWHEWVMSHIQMSHITQHTRVKESYDTTYTYEWVISQNLHFWPSREALAGINSSSSEFVVWYVCVCMCVCVREREANSSS